MAKELSVKQLQAKKVRINADIVKVLEKGKSLATERDAVDALLLVQAELLRKEADLIVGTSTPAVEEETPADGEVEKF